MAPDLDLAPLDWHADAACREHPEVDFLATNPKAVARAKAICRGCLVRAECLDHALDAGPIPVGVWGGTDRAERRVMLRMRNTQAAP